VIDYHGPIGLVLMAIADLTPEAAERETQGIHPDDRARSEEFATTVGGWPRYAKAYPKIYSRSVEYERSGLMGDDFRATVIGHSLVCRAHGLVLSVQRLM